MSDRYAQVAVDVPVFEPFTYAIPAALDGEVSAGHLVQVPFRNRSKTGLVLETTSHLDDPELADKLKEIVDRIDPAPLLSPTDVEFLRFLADYYLAPIGRVVQLALPSSVQVEGIKRYQLKSDESAAEVVAGEEEPELVRAVEFLADQKNQEATIEKLKGTAPKLTYHQLARLEELDLVTVRYAEASSDVGAKTETVYQLVDPPGAGDRVGSKQKRILALLNEASPPKLADNDEASDSDTKSGAVSADGDIHPDAPALALSEIREEVDSPYSSLSGLEERGFLVSWEREVYRDPFENEPVPEPEHHEPTGAQSRALSAIGDARASNTFQSFVLHGVTGSGKTEVYRRSIARELEAGRTALVLLPEIALTPQFVATFRAHFDREIAVLHSGLTPAERFDQWRRIKRNEVDIAIGARSALFAPLRDLGIIVVDEEHDTSFKQSRGPRYNARDMALVRGRMESARVILGSATPSLESYQNARDERMKYLEMPERVEGRPMPPVDLIDMRDHDDEAAESAFISEPLRQALAETFRQDKQAILFLNRRGFSPCVLCQACGHVFRCPNCDVSLTYHRHSEALRCHHCDHSIRLPEACPECGDSALGKRGIGTEQLESELERLFPDATTARLDRDTTTGKQLRKKIRKFRRGDIDVLAGTQMVTKGHDFPNVVTVGVILADLSLNFPDFRSAERTFQLLTQVSGRAGRSDEGGRVYVQTYNPDHYAIQAASDHDYQGFAGRELQVRDDLAYPPHGHLIAIKFESESNARATQASREYATTARRLLREHETLGSSVFMLGPAMAPLSKLKGRSRWQLLLKSRQRPPLRKLTTRMLSHVGYFDRSDSRYRDVRIIVDVDPLNLL